jgi:hypothetical protein
VKFLFFFDFLIMMNDTTEPAAAAMVIGTAKLAMSAEIGSEIRIGKSNVTNLFESLESPARGFSRMSMLRRNKPDLSNL